MTALPETLPALRRKRKVLERMSERFCERHGFRDEAVDDLILKIIERICDRTERDEIETFGTPACEVREQLEGVTA